MSTNSDGDIVCDMCHQVKTGPIYSPRPDVNICMDCLCEGYRKMAVENVKFHIALAWYANEKNYLRGVPGENSPRDFVPPAWFCDVGQRARKALGIEEEQS